MLLIFKFSLLILLYTIFPGHFIHSHSSNYSFYVMTLDQLCVLNIRTVLNCELRSQVICPKVTSKSTCLRLTLAHPLESLQRCLSKISE